MSNVDRIAFSAFRTRILTSEYTYTTPPKIGVKSRCAATTFWGLNARVRASENRWQTTCLRCYAFTSRIVSRTLAIRRNTVKKTAQLRKKPQIVTYDALCEAVWGGDYYGYENSLNVHIRHLREKVEEQPSQPRWIITARGLGYRLAKEESQ